jgi:hypothetical protein
MHTNLTFSTPGQIHLRRSNADVTAGARAIVDLARLILELPNQLGAIFFLGR